MKLPFGMPAPAIRAHFDGSKIVLDEPYSLPANAALLVTVLTTENEADPESETEWLKAAASNEAFAFLKDPREDIYSIADGKPFRDAV